MGIDDADMLHPTIDTNLPLAQSKRDCLFVDFVAVHAYVAEKIRFFYG